MSPRPPVNTTLTIVVVSEMTYTVLSGTLNSSIPYHTLTIVRARPSHPFGAPGLI